jgi:hypothetical protein
MALPFPQYSIGNLYLFPYFSTREEYQRATGQEPPPWDPTRAPKYWFDPNAKNSRSRRVVYERVIADPPAGPDGKPMLDALVLDRDEAATVNIPPKGTGFTNVPGADKPEVPVPLRELGPDEELAFGIGGTVVVRNKKLWAELEQGSGNFTAADRALLRAIAEKLGVRI